MDSHISGPLFVSSRFLLSLTFCVILSACKNVEAWMLSRMQEVCSSLIVHSHQQGPKRSKDCHSIVSYHPRPRRILVEGSRIRIYLCMPSNIDHRKVSCQSSDDLHPHIHRLLYFIYTSKWPSHSRIGSANRPTPAMTCLSSASLHRLRSSMRGDNRAGTRLRNSLTIANTTTKGSDQPCRYCRRSQ